MFSGGGEPSGQYRDFSATAAMIDEGRAEVSRVLDIRCRSALGRGDGSGGVTVTRGRGRHCGLVE